ncbi:unnamed protein product, partial [Prorocentrum cordatum]
CGICEDGDAEGLQILGMQFRLQEQEDKEIAVCSFYFANITSWSQKAWDYLNQDMGDSKLLISFLWLNITCMVHVTLKPSKTSRSLGGRRLPRRQFGTSRCGSHGGV